MDERRDGLQENGVVDEPPSGVADPHLVVAGGLL